MIHTDQGREFESQLFARVCELLELKKTRTMPYRPQSDGQTERFNKTLQQMLSMFVNERRDDWDDHLCFLLFAYNSAMQHSTRCTPNLLMFGRELNIPLAFMAGLPSEKVERECECAYVEWLKNSLECAFEFARTNLECSFRRQKRLYDRGCKRREYEVGSKVWRWYPPKAHMKLGLGWTGPYIVLEKQGETSMKIVKEGKSEAIWVHKDDLKPFIGKENPHVTDG